MVLRVLHRAFDSELSFRILVFVPVLMSYLPPDRIGLVLARKREILIQCIGDTLSESLESAVTANGGKVDEILMLYGFFYDALPKLEDRLKKVLVEEGINVTVAGILCHKNPIVKFELPVISRFSQTLKQLWFGSNVDPKPFLGRCELADIALLATYGEKLPDGGIGNALLAQTKRQRFELGKNLSQTALYKWVRKFSYVAKSHGRAERELPPKEAPTLWHWALTDQPLLGAFQGGGSAFGHPRRSRSWRPAAKALYQLMTGAVGRGFAPPKSQEIGWDQIIHDLIEKTCEKLTRCKNLHVKVARMLRGERARKAVHDVLAIHGGMLVKNSFGRLFANWGDKKLAELGRKIESSQDQYTVEDFELGEGGGDEPPFKATRPSEPDNDGECSFVIFDFMDLEKEKSDEARKTDKYWTARIIAEAGKNRGREIE